MKIIKKTFAKPKPIMPVIDFTILEKGKKMDIQRTDQTMPKLLRIIAAKKSHVPSTVLTNNFKSQESEVVSVPAKIIATAHIKETPKEEILKETVILQKQTMPKLLHIITAKRSHVPLTVLTNSEPQEPEVASISTKIIATAHHVDEIPADKILEKKIVEEETVILQDHSHTEEVTKEVKQDDTITCETSVAAIETNLEDVPKGVVDENKVPKDILDEITETRVACPQKRPEEMSQRSILCKCGPSFGLNGCSCSIAKCVKDRVPCPQEKLEEEPQKSTLCKHELPSNSNNYSCSIVKCTKCNNIIEDCSCEENRFEWNEIYCAHCRLSTMQCVHTPHLKSCLKTDKPKFCGISPLKISSHICTSYCRMKEERKSRKMTMCCRSREECRCRWYVTRDDCLRVVNKRTCELQGNRINCDRSENQCCCAKFTLVKCHKIKASCSRKRAMICLYCDNSQDKCTCRTIEKCSYCGWPSDVGNCQDNKGHARDCEQIARRPNEYRTIHISSWKPKEEIRRYSARNFDDFRSYSPEEYHCNEKPKRQRPEKLPHQQPNIFSEMMNELQQKISESVCCSRCWRNPCCCGSPVDQDKRKEGKKAENRVKCTEIERSPRKSPNNCRCSPSPRTECKSTVQNSMPNQHTGYVCKLTPCRCRKDRSNCKRPLAKCYYCKSLPCTCTTVK
ncbi:uncharacterized protein LOC105838923 [Monomorium pharaonis]|uniref:uncharacterized protein LOC105838923 n=1 Tax=Monomorium pharaonis TaxID=307658 RepID=UPI001746D71A|nr:uncharacterized protein LOC105838923 [Monomorium pharaonis]